MYILTDYELALGLLVNIVMHGFNDVESIVYHPHRVNDFIQGSWSTPTMKIGLRKSLEDTDRFPFLVSRFCERNWASSCWPKLGLEPKFHEPGTFAGFGKNCLKIVADKYLSDIQGLFNSIYGTPLKNQNFENRAPSCFKLAQIRPRAKISWAWYFWWLRKTWTNIYPINPADF